MTKYVTKRSFLFHACLLLGCVAIAGKHAFGQSLLLKLNMIDQQHISRPGLKKRLQRLRVASPGEAFQYANRKTEIEVTL